MQSEVGAQRSLSHAEKQVPSYKTSSLSCIVIVAAVSFLGVVCAFQTIAPEPYMDEVFHVPQTQAYCRGEYGHWDSKITTPPGLYIFGLVYSRLVSLARKLPPTIGAVAEFTKSEHGCGEVVLRQTNWAFSLGTLIVMRVLLLRHMAPDKALGQAILLWLYPVSFFFSFLYYTDTGANFFILLCYLSATGSPESMSWWRRFGSAMAGGISLIFRQTNAIWIAFTLAVCLLQDFLPLVVNVETRSHQSEPESLAEGSRLATNSTIPVPSADTDSDRRRLDEESSSAPSRHAVRRRRPGKYPGDHLAGERPAAVVRVEVQSRSPADKVRGLCNETIQKGGNHGGDYLIGVPPLHILIVRLVREAIVDASRGGPLLRRQLPLAVPLLLFAIFVVGLNGGAIVLGHKKHHAPGGPPHLAQLAYLVAVAASLWGVVGQEGVFSRRARVGFMMWTKRRGFLQFAALLLGVACGLWRFTLAHPFVLSDNRHFTFYVWRRLLRFPALRSAFAPVYVFCGWLVASRLHQRKGTLWVVTYMGAAAVVLVPASLLEPRYLTVPILLAHLESAERSWNSILAGVISCAAVNAAVVYLFLAQSFTWHDDSEARFMW